MLLGDPDSAMAQLNRYTIDRHATTKAFDCESVLEVVKRQDGRFDLLLNSKLYRGRFHADGLAQELCVAFVSRMHSITSLPVGSVTATEIAA